MQDRYNDAQLNAMKDIVMAIVVLTHDGTLREFLRGKQLFLQEEIARELKLRETERLEQEKLKAEQEAVPEPIDDNHPTQKNEDPATE
mgnify:CR=1 FL=1